MTWHGMYYRGMLQNPEGDTAAIRAVQSGHEKCLQILIGASVDLDTKVRRRTKRRTGRRTKAKRRIRTERKTKRTRRIRRTRMAKKRRRRPRKRKRIVAKRTAGTRTRKRRTRKRRRNKNCHERSPWGGFRDHRQERQDGQCSKN